jgi:rieske iron-sulfur protein
MRHVRPTEADADVGDEPAVGRRTALKTAIALGVGICLPRSTALGQDDQALLRPQPGDWLVKIGDVELMPLAPDAIPIAAQQTMAWAMDPRSRTVRSGSRLNRVLLLRFDPETLAAETRARAAGGVVAYTAICTHNGCEVTDWLGEDQMLSCPCHATKFDPKTGARVIDGPAPRPLPALPLALAEGRLVVSRSFTTRVGFELA